MTRNNKSNSVPRRGAAMIVAMVLLLLTGAISAGIISGFYQARRERDQSLIKAQANLLLEDHHQRALQQHEASPGFTGETLKLTEISDSAPGTFELTSAVDPSGDGTLSTEVRYYDENNRLTYISDGKNGK